MRTVPSFPKLGSLALVTILLGALALLFALPPSAQAKPKKVEVCVQASKRPPHRYQTVLIDAKKLASYLARGATPGSCATQCAAVCEDGNACTGDGGSWDAEAEQCLCAQTAVSCNDSNGCTVDSCNPSTGCVNAPQVGLSCNDDNGCTTGEACDTAGECGGGTAVANCCAQDSECNQDDLCAPQVCQGNSCVAQPVVCTAPDLCQEAACDGVTGECVNTPIVCAATETCPEAGTCEPETGQCSNQVGEVEIVSAMVEDVPVIFGGVATITVEGSVDNTFVVTVRDPERCADPELEPLSYQWTISTPLTSGYTARGIQGMDTAEMFVAADSIPHFAPNAVTVFITVSRVSTSTEVTRSFRIVYRNSSLTLGMSTLCQMCKPLCNPGPVGACCEIEAGLGVDCP